jgi:type I restriction enzyme, S subunit
LKPTELGDLPKGWTAEKVGLKFEIRNSSLTYQELEKMENQISENACPVMGVKVSDMNLPNNKKYFLTSNLLKNVIAPNIDAKTIPKDSVIFPKRGAAIATNKKRLSTIRTVLDPNLISLTRKSKGDIDINYFYNWFLTFDLRNITIPGPTPQFNKKDVFPILFPLPSLEEQQQIGSILSVVDSKITLEEKKRGALRSLFESMLSNLMSAKIRVNKMEF